MTDILFKEALLHGNLEVINSLREIKKINIIDFYNVIKEFNFSNGGIYRFYVNFKIFLTAKEFELIKGNREEAKYFTKIMEVIIEKAKEINVFENLEIKINTCDYNSVIKVFIYNLLHLLEYKIKTYLLENPEINTLHEDFCRKFEKYIDIIRKEYIIINHITPIESNNYWKPSWKISYKNQDYFLEGVDTYIDNIFIFPFIICHSPTMYLEIRYINERLTYLKEKTSDYYYNYIKGSVEIVTKNIFDNFPLQIIYRDYCPCIKKHSCFFKPELFKYINIEEFTRDMYILSILPLHIVSYLLGFAVLRADIPSYKNIIGKVKEFNSDYYEKLAIDFNKKYLELIAMGVDCGNSQNDEGDFLDVYYNRVIDYNIDDICQVFNNGVYHLFTSAEFKDLSKKGTNFYNRSEIKTFDPIIYNLRFKRKIKRFFNDRGVKIELNSTLKENFKEIKEAIKNQEISKDEESNRGISFINDSLVNFFLV